MSRKVKKSSSPMSFSLSRWFRKVSTTAKSSFIITTVVLSYALFLLGGGLYAIINQPPPSAFFQDRFYFLYPDISGQFLSDTVISVILYSLGFVGLLAIYQSTKSAYKPRQAYMTLVIGIALLLIAYIFIEGAIQFKISPS